MEMALVSLSLKHDKQEPSPYQGEREKYQEGHGYDTLFAYDAVVYQLCTLESFFPAVPCLMK